LGNFARALHHLDMKDVKKKRLEKIAAKKLKEQKDAYEKKIIQEISKNYKSDWKREIYEGMTTGSAYSNTVAPVEGDGVVTTVDAIDASSYSGTINGFLSPGDSFDGNTGSVIRASGTGAGHGGFNVGGNYLAFQGTGTIDAANTRFAALNPIDSTEIDTLQIKAIVGNDSNGGEDPDATGEELSVMYKTPAMDHAQFLNTRPDGTISAGAEEQIIPLGAAPNAGLNDYSISIPDYARAEGTQFILIQPVNSGGGFDNYGITEIKFQRKAPINVVVPLDSPEAISFVRVGSDEGDPKKRKKKLNDQLAASDEYTTNVLGNQFPGQGARIDGEDPFRSAPLTPDDEIEGSPIGKKEVKKSFSKFSADSADAESESEEEVFTPASSQTTMKPKDEDGNDIPVKPVGGIAVQGADAANLDAQNDQDDTQNTTTTFDPATSDPEEPELDPEETEKEAELSDDEKEELKNQGKSEEEIKQEEEQKKEQAKLDKLTDELIKRNDYIAHDVAGMNEILSNVTWLIGAFNDFINPIAWGMRLFGVDFNSGKLVNNLNIARSVFSGKVENHIPNHREIKEFTDSLIPTIFDDDSPSYIPISDVRHPYADKNIKVDFNGKVSINDGTYQDLADKAYAALGNHGKGYAQLIIPKDGGRPYVHYYDYNYHNLNSPDEGEVPNVPQEILSALTHLLGEMGAVKSLFTIPFVGALKKAIFNYEQVFESLKNKSGLEGWPPGIHGAALTDFKVDIKNLPKETQEMIALHPLSWTDERVANMSDDYLYEQMNLLLDREEIIYQESDDGKSFLDKIGKILKSREANVDPKFAKAFIDINDQYFERLEKYDELQEIYKKPEASLAETKSREDWRALQEEQKEATTREELHKKFSKGIKIPNPKTDGDKSPDWGEWIDGDKKEYEKLIAQQDKFAKDAENYYNTTFDSAYDELIAYENTLERKGNKVVGTREQITKYRKLAAEYDRTYNEYKRLNALQDEPMNKASELLSTFLDDYKRRQAVWQPYLKELNKVYKEVYDEYQELVDEAYTKYQNTIGVENKDGETEYVNGGDYTDRSGKTYAGLGTLTKSVQDEIDEIDLLMKENSDILGSFDPRYMSEKLSQYLVNSEYRGKTINWSPKNKGKGDDSRSGSYQGYGSGYSISDPIIGSGDRDRDRRGRPLGESTLFERLKQKQFFNPNDIKPTFPENPPPQLDPKTGMHPNYGKNAKRFRKLDPISANAMPPTGDPETDAVVDKQRTKPKTKLYDRLKKNIRKDLTNK